MNGRAPTARRFGRSRSRRASLALAGALLFFAASPTSASAKVFVSQNQALAEAFPEASRIERDTFVLRRAQAEAIEALTRQPLESKIVVLHTAWQGETLLGYAHIDVHTVRTQPEAFLVVLDPNGRVRSVRVLAFHEPLDYLPTERWYEQFAGRTRADALRVGRDVHGVVGATLSARAAADGVRRMLAYWQILLRPEFEPADGPLSMAEVSGDAP